VGAKIPLKRPKTEEDRKKVKKVEKKKLFFVTLFSTIFKQTCSYMRPLLSITFPQGFRICKIGHLTSGSGGKKKVKKDRKPKKTEKSEKSGEKKNFFLRGDF
jgi:hypothetical protein